MSTNFVSALGRADDLVMAGIMRYVDDKQMKEKIVVK